MSRSLWSPWRIGFLGWVSERKLDGLIAQIIGSMSGPPRDGDSDSWCWCVRVILDNKRSDAPKRKDILSSQDIYGQLRFARRVGGQVLTGHAMVRRMARRRTVGHEEVRQE
jgi:hypothetical protein